MKEQLLNALLNLGCLQVKPSEPFSYASGLHGPIYCDNRLSLSDPKVRSLIADSFAEKFKELNLSVDSLMGLATAGIPHGALLADRLNLPFNYIRSKAKGHGKKNLIEGKWQEGQKVLVIEDLVNQGASLSSAVKNIMEAGGEVAGCFCIVNYEFFSTSDYQIHHLVSFSDIIAHCKEKNFVTKDEVTLLENWHKDPKIWRP